MTDNLLAELIRIILVFATSSGNGVKCGIKLRTPHKCPCLDGASVFAAAFRLIAEPLLGIFEIENGKIKHWRDYADMHMVQRLLKGETVSAEEGFPPGAEDV